MLYPISEVASWYEIADEYLEPYGKYKAKVSLEYLQKCERSNGKLILVTAITPTKAGEGKTTTTISLLDGLNAIGVKAVAALREPSLGPVFGLKGGATGGGKVTIEPSEDINLHFNGDFHALTSSINLIAAVIDNHIHQGNELNIDPDRIVWDRAIDMNERELRTIMLNPDKLKSNGITRTAHFSITVASEMMAVFCLAKSEEDFLERVGRIIVAYTKDNKPVTVKDLKIVNAIHKLMKEAIKPNIVQTQENNLVFVHGGPFANIAHGCNSILATKMAMKTGEVAITEAGFGADLGAEKFLDIVCQEADIHPDLVVMVITVRALKMHGGQPMSSLNAPNLKALEHGMPNLDRHLSNIKKFGLNVVVAINRFDSDAEEEIEYLKDWCALHGYVAAVNDGFAKGGQGAEELASLCMSELNGTDHNHYTPLYKPNDGGTVKDHILKIAKEIYGAQDVEYSEQAIKQLETYTPGGYSDSYICMAKTPNSFTDDPKVLNAPTDFTIHVKEIKLAAGSKFIIPLTGDIMTLPGLPKIPQAVKMEDEIDG